MRKRIRQKGFSLLEVMVAIAILAVSLLAILNFQSTAVLSSGRAEKLSIATMLAQYQMGQVLLDFEKEFGKSRLPDDRSLSGDFSELGYPDYRWEVHLRRVDIPPPPLPEAASGELVGKIMDNIAKQISEATREVELTILWKELGDDDHSISVVTHLVDTKGSKFGV